MIEPFFYHEAPVISEVYFDMLEYFVYSQLKVLQPSIMFRQDASPPHCLKFVRISLNKNSQTGRSALGSLIHWSSRSRHVFSLVIRQRCVYNTQVTDIAN